MKATKLFFIIGLIFLSLTSVLHSQDLAVKNTKFKQQKDGKVLVTYDLLDNPSQKHTINLSLFLPKSKKTVVLAPQNLAGDFGKGIRIGNDKKITWDLLKDFPKGLHGEGFVFEVDAYVQRGGSKLPWIVGGLAVTSGMAYLSWYLLNQEDDLPPPPGFPDDQ